MDAREFFVVANRFKNSASEAERRTSVSRSYYALFNALLVALSDRGVIFSEKPEDHYRLISYLGKAGSKTAGQVSAALKDLRLDRNRADYEMKTTLDARTTELLYLKASRTMGQFDAIPQSEMQGIIQRIQSLP